MVSPTDGEARDPRPASGLSVSSKLRREDQSEARESDLALLASFKQTDFSTPTTAKPIKLFVWGGASPRVTSWPCSRHLIFNLSCERYTYRPFIRAVIIHYDAKEYIIYTTYLLMMIAFLETKHSIWHTKYIYIYIYMLHSLRHRLKKLDKRPQRFTHGGPASFPGKTQWTSLTRTLPLSASCAVRPTWPCAHQDDSPGNRQIHGQSCGA